MIKNTQKTSDFLYTKNTNFTYKKSTKEVINNI